jgi:hypothetical protein
MRRKPVVIADRDAPATRIAWWASFCATLALIALLGMAKSAQALDAPSASGLPAVALVSAADEEEEGEAETSEDEELEAEECEADEEEECEEETAGADEAPSECLLSSAEATIFVPGNRDQVRLQLRYATTSSTAVTIAYGLHGAKGSLYLGSERKRLGKEGVLRLSKSLTEAQMAKVTAAKDFTVRIRAPQAPGWCQPLFDRHLNVRRATPGGLSWQQRE